MGTEPTGGRRKWTDGFIVAFLALQVALPLRYYATADAESQYDERFAWRMFSPIRAVSCQATFAAGAAGETVNLSAEFHSAWVKLTKRGRPGVMDAMAAHLCDDPDYGAPVRVRLVCKHLDGSEVVVRAGREDACQAR